MIAFKFAAVAALVIAAATMRPSASGGQAAQPRALPDTGAITPEMINAGRAIFHGRGTCFACHGQNLEGGPVAPTLKPHQWKDAKGGEYDAIYYVVTHGVTGTVMVSHPGGISDADAQRVAAYIWAIGHRGEKP